MTVASDFLQRLLKQGEGRSPQEGKPPRLLLSKAKCPAYFEMRDLQEAEAFRGEMQAAVNRGSIALEFARAGSWPRDIAAVVLVDIQKLSDHLGASLLADRVEAARSALAPHLQRNPVLARVLEIWSEGKTVRRCGPTRTDAVLDAIRFVEARRNSREDALIRRESIRLFGDSKRIEALVPWIAVISLGDVSPSGLKPTEVLASMGLFREPQPFLISGVGAARVDETLVRLSRPYLGLPAEVISAFDVDQAPQFVLSVENKQTFHELARLSAARRGFIVYTGGMPSPTWLRVYGLLLDAVPPQTACLHFGDLDLGGYRIAARVSQTANLRGCALRPWRMTPDVYASRGLKIRPVTKERHQAMQAAARNAGWGDAADAIALHPGHAEQEALLPELPDR